MRIKRILVAVVIVLIVASGLFLVMTQRTQAQDNTDILKKLDDILNNQRLIMAGIASLKEELQIVKIRVTQQQ